MPSAAAAVALAVAATATELRSSVDVRTAGKPVTYKWHVLREGPNHRQHFERLDELAESIRANGLLQPLIVRKTEQGPEIVAGARRYRAIGLIDVGADVPCLELDSGAGAAESASMQIVENLQRQDVSPLEEVAAIVALRDLSLSAEEIAARVGKPRAWVYGRLKVASLCERGKELLREGRWPVSVAELVARLPSTSQAKAVDEIVRCDCRTVSEVRDLLAAKFYRRLSGATFDRGDSSLPGGSCSECPKRSGNMEGLETRGGTSGAAADMCTDPACFVAKEEEDWRRFAGNHKVIEGDLNPNQWIDLDEAIFVAGLRGGGPEPSNFAELQKAAKLGDLGEVHWARLEGSRWEVVDRETFARRLAELAGVRIGPSSTPSAKSSPPPARKLEEARDPLWRAKLRQRLEAQPNWLLSPDGLRWLVGVLGPLLPEDVIDPWLDRHGVPQNLSEKQGVELWRREALPQGCLFEGEKAPPALLLEIAIAALSESAEDRAWAELVPAPAKAPAAKKAPAKAAGAKKAGAKKAGAVH